LIASDVLPLSQTTNLEQGLDGDPARGNAGITRECPVCSNVRGRGGVNATSQTEDVDKTLFETAIVVMLVRSFVCVRVCVSETGAQLPESGVFAELLNAGALFCKND